MSGGIQLGTGLEFQWKNVKVLLATVKNSMTKGGAHIYTYIYVYVVYVYMLKVDSTFEYNKTNNKHKYKMDLLTETVMDRKECPLLPLFSVQGDCRAETVNDCWLAVEMAMLAED